MNALTDARRIKYFNYPTTAEAIDTLIPQLDRFIEIDREKGFRYEIVFSGSDGVTIGIATLKVFVRPIGDDPLEATPLIGIYQALELKRFESDIARVSEDNPEGIVELSPNILFNGLFNLYPDPLLGWEIDVDGTGGNLKMVGNLGRMIISSTTTGNFQIVNTKTVLDNLAELETILNVNKIVNNSNVNVLIGSTVGSIRSSPGIYTESLISGGSDMIINGNFNDPDGLIELDYIIINDNG